MGFVEDKNLCLGKEDKSIKRSIDAVILPLVRFLNKHTSYYTTSSCAGRVVLLEKHQGTGKPGRWLYTTHGKVSLRKITHVMGAVGKDDVYLKQESFIVHVCCKSLEDAKRLLKITKQAGLKRSGIIALGRRIMMEIVGSEQMQTLVSRNGSRLIGDDVLKVLVEDASAHLQQNRKHMKRFFSVLRKSLSV